jgi:outer membrane protein insertion porin family
MIKKAITIIVFMIVMQNNPLFAQSYYDFEIGEISFTGNNFFSESELKANIESKETPMWFWQFLNSFSSFGDEAVYFDSSNISIDKQAIKEYYRSYGFFNATVDHSIQVDSSDKTIAIQYQIIENGSVNFGNVSPHGLEELSSYDIWKMNDGLQSLDSTKQFSEAEVQSRISSIKRFLVNNGYVFSKYDSTLIIIDTLYHKSDVDMYFTPGNKFTISETIINKSGKSIEQINNDLITEIADLKPGTVFNQSQIDRSELRLLKTELFNNLDINPILSDTIDNTIPIEINTTIGSLNGLAPEIKVDNEFNFFNAGLGITYTRKNFLGDARKLSVSTSFRLIDVLHLDIANIFKSSAERDSSYQGIFDFNVKLEQPFLFGKPILTTTEAYFRSQTFKEYTENSYGGAQKFDFEMPAYTFITLLRPYLSIDVAERENFLRASNDTISFFLSVTTKSFTPGIGIEIGSSKTNDLQFPTDGNFLFFTPELFHSSTKRSIEYKLVNGSINSGKGSETASTYFYRLQTGFSNYFSISNENTSVIASKLRLGYIQPITSSGVDSVTAQMLIPPNKTFYAGGSNSVRGWKPRDLVPVEKIEYQGLSTETDEIRGGTFWLEGSFELRQKLHQYFGYAVFVDYGNTWNGWRQMQVKNIAVAVGLGLRIYTPIAPFRLDFGTKFYDPADHRMIFKKNVWDNFSLHFGIGEAF